MGGGITAQQHVSLVRQVLQQYGHTPRVVEGGVGGGAFGQRVGLVPRAHPLQDGQQAGHAARVVEGDVGGGITGQQRVGLVLRARFPQAAQQLDHANRVVEGGVGGGPIHRADVCGGGSPEGC